MKKAFWIALVTTLTVGPSALVLGQPYRDSLPLPAFQIYQNMLRYTQDKDFEKVERSLPVLRPIIQAINLNFKLDIEAEIRDSLAKKDQDRILLAIQRLIWLDMKDLLSLGVKVAQESQDQAVVNFRKAYLDYQLLSPYIQVKNFSSDQKIKNIFRKAVITGTTAEDLRKAVEDIDNEVRTAFPELKR